MDILSTVRPATPRGNRQLDDVSEKFNKGGRIPSDDPVPLLLSPCDGYILNRHQMKLLDALLYGFTAATEDGKRIDPKDIHSHRESCTCQPFMYYHDKDCPVLLARQARAARDA